MITVPPGARGQSDEVSEAGRTVFIMIRKEKSMKKRRFLALFLAVLTVLGCALSSPNTALAASINTKYPRTKITGYILSTSNKSAVAYSYIGGGSIGFIFASGGCPRPGVYTHGWGKGTGPLCGYT